MAGFKVNPHAQWMYLTLDIPRPLGSQVAMGIQSTETIFVDRPSYSLSTRRSVRSNTNFVDCIAVIEPFCCLTAHATNFLAVTLSGLASPQLWEQHGISIFLSLKLLRARTCA